MFLVVCRKGLKVGLIHCSSLLLHTVFRICWISSLQGSHFHRLWTGEKGDWRWYRSRYWSKQRNFQYTY